MIDTKILPSEFLTGAQLDGQLLSERILQGPIPPEEARRYGVDIGIVLSRAHSRGIVHGSLSPSLVVITKSGAALIQPGNPPSRPAASYLSPEQLLGAAPDWRSDIFSFGALLRAMVNNTIPKSAPLDTALEGVIAGCLEKDPARRRQRIQNAVIELKLAGRSMPASLPFKPRNANGGPRARFRVVATLALLACAASTGAILLPRNSAPVYRFSVEPEDSKYPGMPSISPNGRYLTWAATGDTGKRILWIRSLDETHAKPIPNTEGAGAPFWSPDSQFIGFFANQFLKKMRIGDGNPDATPQTICPVESLAGGGTWNQDGTILFASGLSTGLARVPAGGGKARPVTTLAEANYERSHLWPQFLPDGKHFIFYVLTDMSETSGVYAGALDSPAYSRVFSSETNAVYAAGPGTLTAKSGYLLYIRDGSLTGQPFNPSKLRTTAEGVTLAIGVGAVESFSLAQISVSNNGTLIYQSGGKPTRQLVWLDRTGKILNTLGEPSDWGPPRISPDGKYVAVGKADTNTRKPVIWILDADGHASQLPDGAGSGSVSPVWSPDGTKIAFANDRLGNDQLGAFDLYIQSVASPGKAELVYRSDTPKNFDDWSRDGKWLLFTDFQPEMNSGVYGLNMGPSMGPIMSGKKPSPIVDTIHAEGYSSLSPDGKWLAYQSDEQGAMEVFVQSFDNGSPGTKKLVAVSVNGGGLPRWSRNGAELFYATQPGRMYAVVFHAHGDDFTVDAPREIFHTRPLPNTWNLYDVSADGQRFLMNVPMEWSSPSDIKVTTSWTKALGQ